MVQKDARAASAGLIALAVGSPDWTWSMKSPRCRSRVGVEARMPAFVVGTPQQHRHLRPEVGRIVDADSVAQGVQRSPQSTERDRAAVSPELIHHELQPVNSSPEASCRRLPVPSRSC